MVVLYHVPTLMLCQGSLHPSSVGQCRDSSSWFASSERSLHPTYRAAEWPIGSGIVESGHKVIMQARLKGAGMHWNPENVNSMLALCCARSNDQWDEEWQQQHAWNRQSCHRIRWERLQKRNALRESKRKELRTLFLPPVAPVIEEAMAPKKSGRTPAQQRWG